MSEKYINVFGIIFFSACFLYGAYIAIASMRNWKKFIDSYKTIDLIKVFGDFGRVLYVLIGLMFCILSVLMILKFFGLGPFLN